MQFIKKLRKERGLSCYALAQEVDVKEETLRYLENHDVRSADFANLLKLKKFFKLSWPALGTEIEAEVLKTNQTRAATRKLDRRNTSSGLGS